MMSPSMVAVPLIKASHDFLSITGPGGTTSATGLPWRVTRMGSRVLRTCSSRARHLALNSEIGTSIMVPPFDHIIDHGQNNGQFNSSWQTKALASLVRGGRGILRRR